MSNPTNATALKARASTLAAQPLRQSYLVSVLFFFSGAAGLVYEVLWFKRFSHLWGNSALAMALVVACFLLGLGAGALLIGRRADRIQSPLLWYGVCEAGIALFALLIPFEIGWLGGLNSWLYTQLHGAALFHAVARGLLTLLIIGPPCVLMGGTLPLLVKQAVQGSDHAGQSAAWLYGVNTAGAALGALAAGFWLIPAFGLLWTNIAAAAANGAIAVVAILVARRFALGHGPTTASRASPPNQGSAADPPPRLLYLAVLLTGLASLMLQMIWTRQLAVMLGGSTYAFSATLFIFLAGVGLGAFLCRLLQRRDTDPAKLIAITIGLLMCFTVAGKFMIPTASGSIGLVAGLRADQSMNALVCVGAGIVLEFVPATCMGVLFPLMVGIASQKNSRIGRTVGAVYAWNTFGSIAGAFLTMLALVPVLSIPGTTALALALYLAALLLLHVQSRGRWSGTLAGVLLTGTVMVLLAARPLDPRVTDYGAFLYGYTPADELRRGIKLLYFREGPACNVMVTESANHRWLRVNGKADASTQVDMETQLALAYLPRCLKPEAQEVLIIGHGSGTTAGASLLFPGTRVTSCEIEPGVFAASQFFAAVNHRPESSDRFTPVLDDGRSFLQATERRFDLIISEPSNPWMAGIASLFTQECYAAVRARLKPGGLFAQWVHLYSLDREDYTMILRTLQSAFPHAALLWINDNNTIIVGSELPITPTPNTLERAQQFVSELPPVKADLQRFFQATSLPALLLSRFLLDEQELKAFLDRQDSRQLNTDLNLRLEFDAPRRLFGGSPDPAASPARMVIQAAGEALTLSKLMQARGATPDAQVALKYQTALFNRHGNAPAVLKAARFGSTVMPGDPFFLTHLLLSPDALDDAAFVQAAARLVELSPDEAAKVGGGLWQRRKHQRAAVVFESLIQRHPSSATVWMSLAMNLHALGRKADADAARKRALQLDPLAGYLRSSITALDAQLRKTEPQVSVEMPPLSLPTESPLPGNVE